MSTLDDVAAFTGDAVDFFTVEAGFAVFLIVCALPSAVAKNPNITAAKTVFSNLYILLMDGQENYFEYVSDINEFNYNKNTIST
ncbi:hypothetical protein [Dyadobacter sediminis]|uniref:hypothetical protein n=1 Tax=Dyadobacter sediminis TaxID=1493691 RepID=UPI0019A4CD22|nr:hypothetical protein [Dyadobacter sediminis]GGC09774.1 hypothetical protein GCM10011325_40770 [Dyadobacter sediminis]